VKRVADTEATSSADTEGFQWWETLNDQPVTADTGPAADNPGDIIDAEIVDEDEHPQSKLKSRVDEKRRDNTDETGPSSGPPKVDEWLDFFSRIILRAASDWYIDKAFRGIDEDKLSEREVARIQLNAPERDRIARPFAELANKTKFTRKHGRSIIATADSIESLWALGMWFSRVNRIAMKYKPRHSKPPIRTGGRVTNERTGQSEPATSNGSGEYQPAGLRYYSPGSG
jgi:hypothetical protein